MRRRESFAIANKTSKYASLESVYPDNPGIEYGPLVYDKLPSLWKSFFIKCIFWRVCLDLLDV